MRVLSGNLSSVLTANGCPARTGATDTPHSPSLALMAGGLSQLVEIRPREFGMLLLGRKSRRRCGTPDGSLGRSSVRMGGRWLPPLPAHRQPLGLRGREDSTITG